MQIFENKISNTTYKKALNSQKKFIRKFGDDRNTEYNLALADNNVLTPPFGCKVIQTNPTSLFAASLPSKPIIIGNIRMGFGHYRISMAMASAARALGYTPLWMDLNSFPETTATKIISNQNNLYSMGSRLSQQHNIFSKAFNKLVWEPLNYTGNLMVPRQAY